MEPLLGEFGFVATGALGAGGTGFGDGVRLARTAGGLIFARTSGFGLVRALFAAGIRAYGKGRDG